MPYTRRDLLTGRFGRKKEQRRATPIEIGPLSAFKVGEAVLVNGNRHLVVADACGLRATDSGTSTSRPLFINEGGQLCLDPGRTCPPAAYLNVFTGQLCHAQEDEA